MNASPVLQSILNYLTAVYGGLPKSVWFFTCVTLINRTGSMVMVFITLYLTKELGFDLTLAGLIVSAYGIGTVVANLAGGWLTDRLGPIPIMVGSMIGGGVWLQLLWELRAPWTVTAGMFLFGVLGESYRPASATILSQLCGTDLRTKAFALDRLAINIGASIGPAVGGLLALNNYVWLFRVDGFTYIAAGIAVWFLPFRKQIPKQKKTQTTATQPARSPWRDTAFLFFVAMCLLCTIGLFQVFYTFPIYMDTHYGVDERGLGLLFALNAAMIIIFEMGLIHMVRNISFLRLMTVGLFLSTLGLGILPFGQTFAFAAFGIIIISVGEMLAHPLAATCTANRAPDSKRGSYMGLFNTSFAAAMVIAPIAGTWLYDHFGADTLWFAVGASGAIAALGVACLERFERRTTPKQANSIPEP